MRCDQMIKILTIFIQDTRPAGPKTRNNDNPDYHQNLRFAPLGCPAMFRRARPQPRLQHEARCWFVDSWFGLHLLVLVTKWQQGGWALFATGETRPIVGGRLQNRFTHCRHWKLFSLTIKRTTPLGWVHDYALQRLTWSPSMGVGLLVSNRKKAGVSNWVK